MAKYLRHRWNELRKGKGSIQLLISLCGCVLIAVVVTVLAFDSDENGMDDAYEALFGLEGMPNAPWLNMDGDLLINVEESLIWTDPFVTDTDHDGFADDADSNALSRAWIDWGDANFIVEGSAHEYTYPEWIVGALAAGGEWTTNGPSAWHVATQDTFAAWLVIEFDRGLQTNDLVMEITYLDATNADVRLDLTDIYSDVVDRDLFGNILTGTGQTVTRKFVLPLATNTAAVAVRIQRQGGEVTIYDCLLYVDSDLDGVDNEQEAQLGTDPLDTDTDGDGLSDYDEVFTHQTDPLSADTDGDGMADGWEHDNSFNPLDPADADSDPDADTLTNLDEYNLGTDPHTPFVIPVHQNVLDAGESHSLFLLQDGTVFTWGNNIEGRLGLGFSGGQETSPTQVVGQGSIGTLGGIIAASSGDAHNLALTTDGQLHSWGDNTYGKLGDDTAVARSYPDFVHGPGNIGVLDYVAHASCWLNHNLAVRRNGELWSWGYNDSGKLGDGTETIRRTPVQVHGLDDGGYIGNIAHADAGYRHSLAVGTDGTVWAWGYNVYGRLGDGTTTTRDTPVKVVDVGGSGVLSNVVEVSAGYRHSLALLNDGTVRAWGFNYRGRLGDGTSITRETPVQVVGENGNGVLSDIIEVHAGQTHSLALDAHGNVWTWGANLTGQLGINSTTKSLTPVKVHGPNDVGTLSNIVAIAAGWDHNLALDSYGRLWAWGRNDKGQLGDGTTTVRKVPVLVDSDADGLSDFWEATFFGSLDQTAADDPDADGLTNTEEQDLGTDPTYNDGDSLPDTWEMAYFGNIDQNDEDDPDNDGLSNLQEYQLGTDPTNSDSDGDGVIDEIEVVYGRDPLVAGNYYAVPFIEAFETNTVVLGSVDGQHGWDVLSGHAVVQTGTVYAGEQALELGGEEQPETDVRQLLAAQGEDVVWLDIMARALPRSAPTGQVDLTTGCFFNEDGHAVVSDGRQPEGQQWVALTNLAAFTPVEWVRVTIKLNYAVGESALYLNGGLVSEGLGFMSQAHRFGCVGIRGESGILDDVVVSTNEPSNLSVDYDNLPDQWELEHFGNHDQTETADADSDGLSNLQEYQLGTDPTNSDSDGDGVIDGVEVLYGRDPLVADNYNALPFVESFETNTVAIGAIGGQHGWEVPTGYASIQTGTVYAGEQALELGGEEMAETHVRQLLAAQGADVVWLDVMAKALPRVAPTGQVDLTTDFFINDQGYPVVSDGHQPEGQQWVTVSDYRSFGTDEWVRVTIKFDYAAQESQFYLEGKLLADGLGFMSPAQSFACVSFRGEGGFVDDIVVSTNEPAGLAMDADNLPDQWELEHFGHVSHSDSDDPDGDGLSNLQEYQLGTDPADFDSDGDGVSDGNEVSSGRDPLVVNNYNALPFVESFETNTVTVGAIVAQHGWEAPSGYAVVQTGTVYAGEQALELGGEEKAETHVRQHLVAPDADIVWLEVMAKALPRLAPTGQVHLTTGCFFNNNGYVVVSDGNQPEGQQWVVLSDRVKLARDEWARVTIMLDYAAQESAVYVDGALVADGLGFMSDAQRFECMGFEGTGGFLDDATVTTNRPNGLSFDDHLPDEWELQYFGDFNEDDDGNVDNDGLTNLEEYRLGTDPTNSDSDGDGVIDGVEVLYGRDPLVADNYNALPFVESFETNTVAIGAIGGQHGWEVPTGYASIQTGTVYAGEQALELGGEEMAETHVRQLLAAQGADVVWLDVMAKALPRVAPTGQVDLTTDFFINDQGYPVVSDGHQPEGQQWVTVSDYRSFGTDEWVRVTIKFDYAAQESQFYLEGKLLADGLGFMSPAQSFACVSFRGEGGFVDDIVVSTNEPAGLAMDADNLPDQWELEHFGHVSHSDSDDPDGDGLSNLEEYQLGTDPADFDSDGDGVSDGTEFASGRDPLAADSYNALPFTERFETNTVVVGSIDGQYGWDVRSGYAVVQTGTVYEGEQALDLGGEEQPETDVRQLLTAPDSDIVWLDVMAKVLPRVAPTGNVYLTTGCFFNNNGYVVVSDGNQPEGQQWVVLRDQVKLARDEWARVTIRLDYMAQQSAIYLNGALVAEGLGFMSPAQHFDCAGFRGKGFVDDATVTTNQPAGLSLDDWMPDAWELAHFGNLDQTDEGDADSDGLTNLREYQIGTDPTNADSDGDGLGDYDEVMVYRTNPLSADTDADGLPDKWEVDNGLDPTIGNGSRDTDLDGLSDLQEYEIGTSPTLKDTDGDGLADGDEITYGTDPFVADTDGDGVSDHEEIFGTRSDPLVVDFDGQVADAIIIPGANTNAAVGQWIPVDTEIQAQQRRGYVEYEFNALASDIYRIKLAATHLMSRNSCSPIDPVDTSDLLVYLDGRYLGREELVAPEGVYGQIRVFTPKITVGTHTLRIFWENTNGRVALRIKDIRLQTLSGPDSDSDGVKDWVETAVAKMTGIDAVSWSVVSPVCLEGKARWADMIDIAVSGATNAAVANYGAGDRWYSDVPLAVNGVTSIDVIFQDGALTRNASVTWMARNVLAGGSLTVRKGDALMLTAIRSGAVSGAVTIDVVGQASYASVLGGAAITHTFATAGTYTINGTHNDGQISSGSMTVVVIGGGFPAEPPACMIGKNRGWSCPNLPGGVTLEVDETMTASRNGATVYLQATKTNRDHYLVTRLYAGGPILDSTLVNTFWVQAAVDSYMWVVERYEDSQLWENQMVTRNLPDGVEVQIRIFIGGVTFDDMTIERWVTNVDMDAIGEYRFRMIHPNSIGASTCHYIRMYQDGVYLGEAYYSGRFMPDE